MGTSPGNTDSYLALAEIMVIWSRIGRTLGINFAALNCTHPSAALVMIKVFPYLTAIESISADVLSNYAIEANIAGESSTFSYTPEGLMKLVQSKVSSQSKIMAVS